MKIILIILFVLALIYFSYSTFQEDIPVLDPNEKIDTYLNDISTMGTFVWNLYDPIMDDYEAYVTNDEDYGVVPGAGYLHSYLHVNELETTTKKTHALSDPIGTIVNITIDYHNLSTDILYETQIQFNIGTIPVTINDIILQTPFTNEFDLSMQVLRTAELVPIVQGSHLEPEEPVTITISSIQGHTYDAKGTLFLQLDIIEQTTIE